MAVAKSMIEVRSVAFSMRVMSVGVFDGGHVFHRDETTVASCVSRMQSDTCQGPERNSFEDDR